jgi:hypothetical protein
MNKEQINNSEDDATEFKHIIKTEVEELEWLKSDKIYKLNKEGKFDVMNYKLETPVRAIFSELEDQNYTREEWEEVVKSRDLVYGAKDNFFDSDIIAAAKAFMIDVVGVYRKKAIVAEQFREFDTLEELRKNILMEAKEKDMVLYRTVTFEKLKSKEGIKYAWLGAFVDKQ